MLTSGCGLQFGPRGAPQNVKPGGPAIRDTASSRAAVPRPVISRIWLIFWIRQIGGLFPKSGGFLAHRRFFSVIVVSARGFFPLAEGVSLARSGVRWRSFG